LFIDERTDDYMRLVEDEIAEKQNQGSVKISIAFDEEDEINVDDI
jgi:hypothetical protein